MQISQDLYLDKTQILDLPHLLQSEIIMACPVVEKPLSPAARGRGFRAAPANAPFPWTTAGAVKSARAATRAPAPSIAPAT
jgi:hypothetical protein